MKTTQSYSVKHYVRYFAFWLIPVLIGALSNYVFAQQNQNDVGLTRLMLIHLFYWYGWALFCLKAWPGIPVGLDFHPRVVLHQTVRMLVNMLVMLMIFAGYYLLINSTSVAQFQQFSELANVVVFGLWPFHLMNCITFLVLVVGMFIFKQNKALRDKIINESNLRAQSEALNAKLSHARLAALTQQIHPHFLFNTLNSIAALIETDEKNQAYNAITTLADSLRGNFESGKKPLIQLSEEVDLCESLLQIAKIRFAEKLCWDIKVSEEVKTVLIPPFLIQPLVENSLRHGVEGSHGPTHISLHVEWINNILNINVSDDAQSQIHHQEKPFDLNLSEGGLKNVYQRIELMLQQSHQSHEPDFFNVTTDSGFSVQLQIPITALKHLRETAYSASGDVLK